MLASSSNKRYGRGNASVVVDPIFSRKPTTDPFVFDSDSESSSINPKPAPSSKKKVKVKSGSCTNQQKSTSCRSGGKTQTRGRRKTVVDPQHSQFDTDNVPPRCTTRSNSTSSSKSSNCSFPSMQITSTTVYQSDNVESNASVGSDYENTEPLMSISTETVTVSTNSAIDFLASSPSKLARSLRRSTRSSTRSSASSAGSRESVNGAESDRLRDFLQVSLTRVSPPADSCLKSVTSTAPVESERLKQFLGLRSSKSRTPSVSSCDSSTNCTTDQDGLSTSLQPPYTRCVPPSAGAHPVESDKLKSFLQSDSSTNKCARGRVGAGRPKEAKCKVTAKRPYKKRKEKYTRLVESERLRKFLESDVIEGLSSDSDDSSKSLDTTLVPHHEMQESERLQRFLASPDTTTPISSPSSPSHKLVESARLKAFLQSDINGATIGYSTTKATRSKPAAKRFNNQTQSASKHSGLSQELEEISMEAKSNEQPSPPKRKYVTDQFSFDNSCSDDNSDTPVNDSASTQRTLENGRTSSNFKKPVINFEKMEGQKSKAVSKPARKLLGSPMKSHGKYRYNHRAWLNDQNEDEVEIRKVACSAQRNQSDRLTHPLALKKVFKYPERLGEKISTQVKVRHDHKQLYTVVRNVRQAHECQDHGENQQIDDDLDFLLEGLEPREKVSSRYLSAVSLANKCTNATFRMHLRSHSSLSHIFSSLMDACSDPRLALSTTAIMFMLCQDRLNMDLDRTSLRLMVQLLEYDDKAHLDNKQDMADYSKSIDTVYDLYQSAIPTGEELLDKSDLSPGYLAMECLLVLTSRRSGDWFKEELREAGAVVSLADSIIDKTVIVMSADYDMQLSAHVLIHIKKICRGLRVLEHVTAYNAANQKLIIKHQDGEFVLSLGRLLMFGVEAIATHSIDHTSHASSAGPLLLQMLLGVLRVLVNVTHDSERGCATVNSFNGVIEVLLKCILQSCQYVLQEQRFDLLVLGIGLSINMCEHSADSRHTLLHCETLTSYDSICEQESTTALHALVLLFNQRLRAAEKIEAETGQLQESDVTRAVGDDLSESITEVLHKAGRHMEDTIVASYIALLLGVIVQHSPDYIDQIKQILAGNSFEEIIDVLHKFHTFMKMADAASGNTGSKSISTVIGYLRECT